MLCIGVIISVYTYYDLFKTLLSVDTVKVKILFHGCIFMILFIEVASFKFQSVEFSLRHVLDTCQKENFRE